MYRDEPEQYFTFHKPGCGYTRLPDTGLVMSPETFVVRVIPVISYHVGVFRFSHFHERKLIIGLISHTPTYSNHINVGIITSWEPGCV